MRPGTTALAHSNLSISWQVLCKARAAGFKDTHIVVLGALLDSLQRYDGIAQGVFVARISRHDIAHITGLTPSQVQRALSHLCDERLIWRAQDAKVSGEVSWTLLSARALRWFGLRGGLEITTLPSHAFLHALINEHVSVAQELLSCWDGCVMPSPALASRFAGGGKRWLIIEAALSDRIAEVVPVQAATDAALGHAAVRVSLNDRVVGISESALRAHGDRVGDAALKTVDAAFIGATLSYLSARRPEAITDASLPRLVAEIAFSRHVGFVSRHNHADGARVLASCIGRGGWKMPRKMPQSWYAAASSAVFSMLNQQGVRMCVAN
ncbi:MAG: winged helix-turn-helix domain-containing protein [Aquimonas sp.]|nr:winged helix-turn-helix domain-containing protein [Aquimonas sp.]